MKTHYNSIVIGGGIAGLGVGAILSKESRQKVLLLEKSAQPGGRLMSYGSTPSNGWRIDIGLHFIELGMHSSCHRLNARVGKNVEWAPFSKTVELWDGEKFVNLAEMLQPSEKDKKSFRGLLQRVAQMEDYEIEAWDDRSFNEWLNEYVQVQSVKEVLSDLAMIMTTIPDTAEMAAGEVLYIARENLRATRQVLQATYPLNGCEGITRGLVEVMKDNGAEIRCGCEADEIIIRDERAAGVRISKKGHPYDKEYCIPEAEEIYADRVICAVPVYRLGSIIDLNPEMSVLPGWWIKRINDIQNEITGLVGFMIGLSEPVIPQEKLCFYSALKTRHAGLPFQFFAASNFAPRVAPPGKQLIHSDVVCEHVDVADKFKRRRISELMWQDLKEMFPSIEDCLEWKVPYFVDGCDGLARKPGLVGRFKPGLKAPDIQGLYFAGDTYQGRGLAANGAALSAMECADLILTDLS